MKENLSLINKELKAKYLFNLESLRSKLIKEFPKYREEYFLMKPIEKYDIISQVIGTACMFNDKEILSLIESYGYGEDVTKYFASIYDTFRELEDCFEISKYLIPFETVIGFYRIYSDTLIKVHVIKELRLDFGKYMNKVRRQEKNGNVPEVFKDLLDYQNEIKALYEREAKGLSIPINPKYVASTAKKYAGYHRKIYFQNLYKSLLDFNIKAELVEIHEPDFKCEFYELFKILERNQALFEKDYDKELGYGDPENCRYKIKRVEYLILS